EGARKQLDALAMMDDATQGHMQQFIKLGSQMEQMGADGRAAFQEMADQLELTNPGLYALLENIGLIDAATGDVDFDFLADANSDMQDLITSIDTLTMALAEAFDLDIDVKGKDDVDAVTDAVNSI